MLIISLINSIEVICTWFCKWAYYDYYISDYKYRQTAIRIELANNDIQYPYGWKLETQIKFNLSLQNVRDIIVKMSRKWE